MPLPILASLLSRVLASRVGASAIAGASRMKGFGHFLAGVAPVEGAAAAATETAGGQSAKQRAASMVDRLFANRKPVAGQSTAAGGPQAPPVVAQPVRPSSFAETVSRAKGNFGDILSGRMSRADAVRSNSPAPSIQPAADGGQQSSEPATPPQTNQAMNAFATVAKAGGGLAGIFATLTIAGKKLGEAQVDQQRSLKQFNAQISMAFSKLDFKDMIRARKTGSQTAASTEALTSAIDQMRDTTQPLEAGFTNLYNALGTVGVKLATNLAEVAVAIGEWLSWIQKTDPNAANAKGVWHQAFIDTAKRHEDRHRPKPKRPSAN